MREGRGGESLLAPGFALFASVENPVDDIHDTPRPHVYQHQIRPVTDPAASRRRRPETEIVVVVDDKRQRHEHCRQPVTDMPAVIAIAAGIAICRPVNRPEIRRTHAGPMRRTVASAKARCSWCGPRQGMRRGPRCRPRQRHRSCRGGRPWHRPLRGSGHRCRPLGRHHRRTAIHLHLRHDHIRQQDNRSWNQQLGNQPAVHGKIPSDPDNGEQSLHVKRSIIYIALIPQFLLPCCNAISK